MTSAKIKTSRVYPPIPIRTHDWCAYIDGEEERGEYGWGRTEQEAIDDFMAEYGEPDPEAAEMTSSFTFHTAPNGDWRVAVLLSDNRIAVTDTNKYANEATATLAAIAAHQAKPFMNYIAVRA